MSRQKTLPQTKMARDGEKMEITRDQILYGKYINQVKNDVIIRGRKQPYSVYVSLYQEVYAKNKRIFRAIFDNDGIITPEKMAQIQNEEESEILGKMNERVQFIEGEWEHLRQILIEDIGNGIDIRDRDSIDKYSRIFRKLSDEFPTIFLTFINGGPEFNIRGFMETILHPRARTSRDGEQIVALLSAKQDIILYFKSREGEVEEKVEEREVERSEESSLMEREENTRGIDEVTTMEPSEKIQELRHKYPSIASGDAPEQLQSIFMKLWDSHGRFSLEPAKYLIFLKFKNSLGLLTAEEVNTLFEIYLARNFPILKQV